MTLDGVCCVTQVLCGKPATWHQEELNHLMIQQILINFVRCAWNCWPSLKLQPGAHQVWKTRGRGRTG
jgi:hypothetical protein